MPSRDPFLIVAQQGGTMLGLQREVSLSLVEVNVNVSKAPVVFILW
jgi:hypothetical protein